MEAEARWRNHGALYELIQTDDEINAEIVRLQSQGFIPYDDLSINLRIKTTSYNAFGASSPEPTLITVNYS